MKIRFLGAHNTESLSTRMVSLMVDGKVALDAGGLTAALTIEEQLELEAVLLTHGHYDHIRDIPALGMNLFLHKTRATLYGHRSVKKILVKYLLNGETYSAFFQKPADYPTFSFKELDDGSSFQVAGIRVAAVALPHLLPVLGYALTSPQGKTLFYSGDTGPGIVPALVEITPDLLIIEVTAPNRFRESIRQGGHLTPGLLREELLEFRKVKGYTPLTYCVHMNAALEIEIHSQLAELAHDGLDVRPAFEGLEIEM